MTEREPWLPPESRERLSRVAFAIAMSLVCLAAFRIVTHGAETQPPPELRMGDANVLGIYEVVAMRRGCEPRDVEATGFRVVHRGSPGLGPLVKACEDYDACERASASDALGAALPQDPAPSVADESTPLDWTGALAVPTFLHEDGEVWRGESHRNLEAEGSCVRLARTGELTREGSELVYVSTILRDTRPGHCQLGDEARPHICADRLEVRLRTPR